MRAKNPAPTSGLEKMLYNNTSWIENLCKKTTDMVSGFSHDKTVKLWVKMDLNHKAFFTPPLGLSFSCSGAKNRADCLAYICGLQLSMPVTYWCVLQGTGPYGHHPVCETVNQALVKRQAQNFINLNISWSEFWILFMGEKKLVNYRLHRMGPGSVKGWNAGLQIHRVCEALPFPKATTEFTVCSMVLSDWESVSLQLWPQFTSPSRTTNRHVPEKHTKKAHGVPCFPNQARDKTGWTSLPRGCQCWSDLFRKCLVCSM